MTSGVLIAMGWLLLVLLLGAVALPVTTILFSGRGRSGAPFAIPLSLAALLLGTFWLGRLSLPWGPLIVILGLGGLTIAGTYRREIELPVRAYTESAAVFTAGFVLVAGLVSVAPAITASGETYWNFGLLQSLLRTAQLPPEDPWFAGEPVRYYYGGHLLLAALAELTNTPGRFAYNLGLAVTYGTLLTAAYAVARTIALAREQPPRLTGAFGVVAVGIASNLHPVVWGVLTVLPDPIGTALALRVRIDPSSVTTLSSFSILDAAHFSFTNTDFPMYSVFVHGLHPHFMSPPFLLLLVGVLLAYYQTPARATQRRVGLLVATTPVIGIIAFINTWSLPTAGGLVALVVALSPAHPMTMGTATGVMPDRTLISEWGSRLVAGLLVGIAAGLLGMAWVAPYFLHGLAGDPGLGLLPPRSNAWFFVYGYGGFLLAFAGALTLDFRDLDLPDRHRIGALATGIVLLAVAWLADFPGLVFVAPVLLAGLYLRLTGRGDFSTLLVIAGAGLALLIEIAYVRESAEFGRINTVYKVYSQIWVLWGVAAGVALSRLYGGGNQVANTPRWRQALAVGLIIVLSVYTIAGIGGNATLAVEFRVDPSLDGLAYLEGVHPDYAAALEWLAAHPGQPTIVSAPVPEHQLYQFNASPAASMTGIPTVVGWNHEADYRGEAAYRERVRAVDGIYAGNRTTRARLLRAYDVTYIWFGEAEATRYYPIDYSRDPGISRAFRADNITIYRVNHSALAAG